MEIMNLRIASILLAALWVTPSVGLAPGHTSQRSNKSDVQTVIDACVQSSGGTVSIPACSFDPTTMTFAINERQPAYLVASSVVNETMGITVQKTQFTGFAAFVVRPVCPMGDTATSLTKVRQGLAAFYFQFDQGRLLLKKCCCRHYRS